MGDLVLSVNDLSKKFGSTEAVRSVNFSIPKGAIYSLIGPNGSGKTTIVKMVAGLLRQNSGSIQVCGKDTVRDPVATKSLIGYIPDEPTVWADMTGEEFLHFTGALFGMTLQERRSRIPQLLSLFHLQGIEKEQFGQYSRGNRQKFSILAAMLHAPKLLLIDEPIVGLDPESARIAKDLFAKYAKEGGAILLVTHTLPVAEELSDTIGILKRGTLIAEGTLFALRTKAGDSDLSLEGVYEALAE